MATYYVKTDGNDGNDGTSWAQGKATIQAGINLAGAGGGDTINVAPGRYMESALNPTNPGVTGSWHTLIGDVDGSAGSGLTGPVIIDSSSTYGGTTTITIGSGTGATAAKWNYWNIKKVIPVGGVGSLLLYPNVTFAINVEDCLFINQEPYACVTLSLLGSPGVDTTHNIKFTRCGFFKTTSANLAYDSCVYMYFNKTTDFNANPESIFTDCFFYHVGNIGAPVYMDCTASQRMYTNLVRCTLMGPFYSSAARMAIGGANASYAKFDASQCYAQAGQAYSGVTVGTSANNYFYGCARDTASYTGFTRLTAWPMWPMAWRNFADSALLGTVSASGTDLFGRTRSNEPGHEEYDSTREPTAPTGEVNSSVAAQISQVSGVSRGRIVNAGGI